MLDLCLACASQPLPAEKHIEAYRHRLPCCGRAVCEACLRRRPRLRHYCLLCQRGDQITAHASSSKAADHGFVIGDDEQDDEDELNEKLGLHDEPPAYEDALHQPAATFKAKETPSGQEKEKEKPRERADACRLYYISTEDTLVGIALAHGVTPRALALHNKLPPAILAQPNLIASSLSSRRSDWMLICAQSTRQFLLLPPHARTSARPSPLRDPEAERQRLLLRRFQVAAKCADVETAKVYIDAVFEERREEQRCILENRRRRAVGDVDDAEVPLRIGGELEDALGKYEDDRRWEQREAKAGRRPASLSRRM